MDSKRFYEECDGKIEILVRCGHIDLKQKVGISHYLRASKLSVEREMDIKTSSDYEDSLRKQSNTNPKCIAFVLGKFCLPSDKHWLSEYSEITNYIKRPKILTQLTEDYIKFKGTIHVI